MTFLPCVPIVEIAYRKLDFEFNIFIKLYYVKELVIIVIIIIIIIIEAVEKYAIYSSKEKGEAVAYVLPIIMNKVPQKRLIRIGNLFRGSI